MEPLAVECLHCHASRIARRDRFGHFEPPECPACGYLGWKPATQAVSEPSPPRERLRDGRLLPTIA